MLEYHLHAERAIDKDGILCRQHQRLICTPHNCSVAGRAHGPLQLMVAQRAGTVLLRGGKCAKHEEE